MPKRRSVFEKVRESENFKDLLMDLAETGTRIPLLGFGLKLLWKLRGAKVLLTRDAHYESGARLLKAARDNIVVLSTLRAERGGPVDVDESALDVAMREYFIELHKIGYENRCKPAEQVSITRHADLRDESKCDEAISLLYHCEGVAVQHAQLPIEFLCCDDRSIMVGFPNDKGELAKGFLLKNDEHLCKTMREWITQYATNPTNTVLQSRKDLKSFKPLGQHHGPNCMCNLLSLFEGEIPEPESAPFDDVAVWYPGLFDEEDTAVRYSAIFHELTKLPGLVHESLHERTLLDCGCGPGTGAAVISDHFRYFGIDKSPEMIAQAKKLAPNMVFKEGDLFPALLGITRVDFPKKLSAIAFQGNTFDYFLGRAQKALALYMLDNRLKPGGVMLFTGATFDATAEIVTRTLNSNYDGREIQYRTKHSGHFLRMSVPGKSTKEEDRVNLYSHHIGDHWLESMLRSMGYTKLKLDVGHSIMPGRADPYYLLVFQKKLEGT